MANNDLLIEIGSTGLNRYSGYVQEEFLRELQGPRWVKTIKEMSDQDPVIAGILFVFEMLIRQVKWTVKPASEDQADVDAAQFVEECRCDMSATWEDTLAEVLSMLPYGWSYLETIYKYRMGDNANPSKRSKYTDGRLGWRKWSIRSQDTLDKWEFDTDGGIQGMWQQAPPTYLPVMIPVEKALLFRTTSRKNNPEGRSVLRGAYRPWYYKKNMELIEGIGVERDLAGLPFIRAPKSIMEPNAPPAAQQLYASLKTMGTNLRNNEEACVILPSDKDQNGNFYYDLTLLTSGGARQFDTDKIITRYDQRIAMTVLADFILLGHEAVGSFSLSSDKTTLFSTAVGAWLDSIADVINRHAIPRLLRLNGIQVEKLPELIHGDLEKISLEALSAFITAMNGAGMPLFPDQDLENYLRQQADLPLMSEEARAEYEAQRQAEQEAAKAAAEAQQQDNQSGQDGQQQGQMSNNEKAAMLQAAARILANIDVATNGYQSEAAMLDAAMSVLMGQQ